MAGEILFGSRLNRTMDGVISAPSVLVSELGDKRQLYVRRAIFKQVARKGRIRRPVLISRISLPCSRRGRGYTTRRSRFHIDHFPSLRRSLISFANVFRRPATITGAIYSASGTLPEIRFCGIERPYRAGFAESRRLLYPTPRLGKII